MLAIPSTITVVAFEVRELAASIAASGLDINGNSEKLIAFHSPDSNLGSINSFLRAPKETPPMSQAAYVAAVFGLDLVCKFQYEKNLNS